MDDILDEIFATIAVSKKSSFGSYYNEVVATGGVQASHEEGVDKSGALVHEHMTAVALKEEIATIQASMGRTVDIGNKESARVSINVHAVIKKGDLDFALDALEEFVFLMLDREVAGVLEKPIPDMPEIPPGYMFGVSLQYGVTLNMGNYQFMKPGVGLSWHAMRKDFFELWKNNSSLLSDRIKKQIKQIKAGNKKSVVPF